MKKYLYITLTLLLLTSCATIINSPIQKVEITTDNNISNITLDSSNLSIRKNEVFYVLRDKSPLIIRYQVDSSINTIKIASHTSFLYWSNIFFNYGIGCFLEWNHPERYKYPRQIHLTCKNGQIEMSNYSPAKKGEIFLNISIPYINMFHIKSGRSYYNNWGFIGSEYGIDYVYNDHRYISLNIGLAIDNMIPVPAAIDIFEGEKQNGVTTYVNLRKNQIKDRFDFGYGINISKLSWFYSRIGENLYQTKHYTSYGSGFSFSTQYRFGKYFRLGLLYQPTLLLFNYKPVFDYQHFFSVELIWKIKIGAFKN
ncbi:MAG TPA: hypothetical protein DEA97_04715 [Bacteroidales bacterium]|nr:MAG: hypothetical protein A2281_08965 [Bacteroidetes bacterium RIFOXYA12_FULL_38_20]HBS85833.1 hypothetical protein [Bacteroidales bacterium]